MRKVIRWKRNSINCQIVLGRLSFYIIVQNTCIDWRKNKERKILRELIKKHINIKDICRIMNKKQFKKEKDNNQQIWIKESIDL